MALTFTGRRYHDEQTGTVVFPAWSGEKRVNCRITDEALMFMFGATPTDTGLLEAFDGHCASIQVAAQWKFEAGTDPLQVVISSGDFPDKKPAPTPEPKITDPAEAKKLMEKFRRDSHGKPAPAEVAAAAMLAKSDPDAEPDDTPTE